MRRIQAVAIHTLVAKEILRSIALGEYLPGQQLPSERQLSQDLGVSRVTVREALEQLTEQGFLKRGRGAGGRAVVQPALGGDSQLYQHLQQAWPDFVHALEMRSIIEPQVAALAAWRRTAADLRAVEALLCETRQVTDPYRFRRLDSAFHLALADAARNPVLRQSVEDARGALFWTLDLRFPSLGDTFVQVRDRTALDHEEILTAVAQGDAEQARAAMAQHLRQTGQDVQEDLKLLGSSV